MTWLRNMNRDQISFLVWSFGLGAIAPLSAYLVVVFGVSGTEELTAPVDRGQFWILTLGLLMATMRSVRGIALRDVGPNHDENLLEIVHGICIFSLICCTVAWTVVTVAFVTNAAWQQAAGGLAWFGAVFFLLAGYLGVRVLSFAEG